MDHYDEIASFIVDTKPHRLPPEVVELAKSVLLDTLGCALGGLESPVGKASIRYSQVYFPGNEATIWGTRLRASALGAALSNSYLANALDADDGHREARGHPGGVIVPVALVLAEKKGCSGLTLLEAIAVGYEAGIRCGMAANSDRNLYFGSAYWGCFGAAAAASYLLNLTKKQALNALGITEMQAPSSLLMGWVRRNEVPMIKEGMGWGALTGIASAYMAREGFTGTFTLFDLPHCKTVLAGLNEFSQFQRIYQKPHAGCRWTHGAIDAALRLKKAHQLSELNIASITVKTFSEALDLKAPVVTTIEQAEYSVPYLVALAFIFGQVGPEEICSNLHNEKVIELARKVHLVEDKQFTSLFPGRTYCQMEVQTKQNEVFLTPPMQPLGDYDRPLGREQLENKFRLFSQSALEDETIDKLVETIKGIDKLPDVRRLVNMCVCG
ncbi:MAG: MmgE/PrpD family protein [Firmicutes bacterium]|nr:MmgE/PrpD family protein [Bacillota bacterium]